jgi:aminoglycoside phosphotransferase (APT) family kinase protein
MPVSDAELLAGLRAALGRPVALEERRPCPYASTAPLEEVRVDGEWLVFKDLSAGTSGARPASAVDPLREVAAYRDVLVDAALDTPALRGALVDRDGARAWLFLERIDGVPLWQVGDFSVWEAAARWLARLHAGAVPPGARGLARYDASWLRGWVRRAAAQGVPARVLEAGDRAIERLAAWPPSVLHGEFYPSNVIVQDGTRIRPVDWETAGVGPGFLDLGALTSGRWTDDQRARLESAYREALPVERRPRAAELAAAMRDCRLLVAVQWLAWEPRFTPPPEHAHDWLADAERLAR